MTVRLFLAIVLFVAALGKWSWLVIGWSEWADWWHDLDTARKSRLSRRRFMWMKTVSWVGTRKVRISAKTKMPVPIFVWCVGFALIGIITVIWPPAPGFVVSAVLLHGAITYTEPESDEITSIRAALASIIGTDSKGAPPRIMLSGSHPAGGPQTLTILPIEGWKFWSVEIWNNIERAVEKKLTGDWEKVSESDTAIVYERLPQLPDFVPYTAELRDYFRNELKLPWNKIPIGPDGLGGWIVIDLLNPNTAHWLITGDNGSGKTTCMGFIGNWLADHRDEVDLAIIDIKGFGLKRFVGREGVVYEALPTEEDGFEPFDNAFGWLRREVSRRRGDLIKSNKFHKHLVVLWDEAEETISDASQFGAKTPGVEHPTMVMNAMTVGRMGREYRVHLIVGTQRADGTSIPTKFRAQLRGRIHYGKTDQKGAEMAVGSTDAPRVTNLKGPVGICVAKTMAWIKTTQGIYLANPLSEDEPKQARIDAEKMLPPIRKTPLPDWANYGTPESPNGHSAPTVAPAPPPVSAPLSVPIPASSNGNGNGNGTGNGNNNPNGNGNGNGQVAEGPLETRRRKERERKAKQRKQDRLDARDPDWEHHGKKRGWLSGCRCRRCKAWADGPRVDVIDGQVQ